MTNDPVRDKAQLAIEAWDILKPMVERNTNAYNKCVAAMEALRDALDAPQAGQVDAKLSNKALREIVSEMERMKGEQDAFWLYVKNAYDIEPRSYFEEKYPYDASAAVSPLQMAAHYLWKRTPKPEAAQESQAAPRQRIKVTFPGRVVRYCSSPFLFGECKTAPDKIEIEDVPADKFDILALPVKEGVEFSVEQVAPKQDGLISVPCCDGQTVVTLPDAAPVERRFHVHTASCRAFLSLICDCGFATEHRDKERRQHQERIRNGRFYLGHDSCGQHGRRILADRRNHIAEGGKMGRGKE